MVSGYLVDDFDGEMMDETEKITINMNVVDLGKIDLLVARGFYASRTDCIRASIRDLLNAHNEDFKKDVDYKTAGLGVMYESRDALEKLRQVGEQKDIFVIGMLIISDEVTPDLARAAIRSLRVYGVLRASEAVKAALADRMS
jgi:Arc/MetJ-type ribon-helix-helix transcriptional regulator